MPVFVSRLRGSAARLPLEKIVVSVPLRVIRWRKPTAPVARDTKKSPEFVS